MRPPPGAGRAPAACRRTAAPPAAVCPSPAWTSATPICRSSCPLGPAYVGHGYGAVACQYPSHRASAASIALRLGSNGDCLSVQPASLSRRSRRLVNEMKRERFAFAVLVAGLILTTLLWIGAAVL